MAIVKKPRPREQHSDAARNHEDLVRAATAAALDRERAHHGFDARLLLAVTVAQSAAGRVRPGGHAGVHGRHRRARTRTRPGAHCRGHRRAPALIANLAVEVAPVRVNLIAAGFVDTPLSGSRFGKDLEARRQQLRPALPIGRVVGPADVAALAALAVHIMANTALTGGTYTIDGGQQLISS